MFGNEEIFCIVRRIKIFLLTCPWTVLFVWIGMLNNFMHSFGGDYFVISYDYDEDVKVGLCLVLKISRSGFSSHKVLCCHFQFQLIFRWIFSFFDFTGTTIFMNEIFNIDLKLQKVNEKNSEFILLPSLSLKFVDSSQGKIIKKN